MRRARTKLASIDPESILAAIERASARYVVRSRLTLTLTVIAASVTSGCGHVCRLVGCLPGADVIFSRALDPSKTYAVQVVADGSTSTCAAALNATECEVSTVFTGSEVTVANDGSPYPSGGFAGIRVPGQPSRIEVTISEAGQVLAEGRFESVHYRGVELNGQGCGTCAEATVSLTVK